MALNVCNYNFCSQINGKESFSRQFPSFSASPLPFLLFSFLFLFTPFKRSDFLKDSKVHGTTCKNSHVAKKYFRINAKRKMCFAYLHAFCYA